LDVRRDERHVVLEDVSMRLRRLLKEDDVLQNGVASLRVSVREKEPYSVWRKQHMQKKRRTADDEAVDEGATPLDTIAFRVVLDPESPAEAEALCYHALKLVQQTWQPIKDRTKDYVANPKPNGYQSIHTTSLMRLHGQTYPFEVQIRTRSMHLVAEFGSAAHALYSKGKDEDVKGGAAAPAAPKLAAAPPVSGFAWPTVPGKAPAAHHLDLEALNLQEADDSLWSRRLDARIKRRHADGHDSALGASLGASLGAKLRSERVFVLARGGRVLTVASQSTPFDVRRALMNDLEMDAGRRGAGYAAQHRNSGGHLAINGRRVEWLQSLETKLLTGDEISWTS
jgi:(p)ppGpp synthase/HD superfamily hydrolase